MKDVLKKIIKFDFTPTIIFYILFMVLTVLLVYVDTQPIGLGGSLVGLATVNGAVFDYIGKSLLWYNITEILGKVAILYMFGFAIYGLAQWVDRHKLRRVDKDLFVLAFIYVLIAGCYAVFEIFIINFRPVLVTTEMEASYPSSHTMLVVCVMATAIMQFHSKIKKKKVLRIVLEIISAAILVVSVVGRMLSGVHWFTDILGALLLSGTLITFYYALVKRVRIYEANKPKGKRVKREKNSKRKKGTKKQGKRNKNSDKEIRDKRKAKRVERAKKKNATE
ncbi:MAG: phosphatase PAP2 family protein [Lachnospiraceae bacterium]|nr:phosphatase PAP2 family protein [Lachnospiraceae bacterium]